MRTSLLMHRVCAWFSYYRLGRISHESFGAEHLWLIDQQMQRHSAFVCACFDKSMSNFPRFFLSGYTTRKGAIFVFRGICSFPVVFQNVRIRMVFCKARKGWTPWMNCTFDFSVMTGRYQLRRRRAGGLVERKPLYTIVARVKVHVLIIDGFRMCPKTKHSSIAVKFRKIDIGVANSGRIQICHHLLSKEITDVCGNDETPSSSLLTRGACW